MTFFTIGEYNEKYGTDTMLETEQWQIEVACEMVYSFVGLRYRAQWNENNVPDAIKRASMEQCRFLREYQMPFLDNRGSIQAGNMSVDLKTDLSTLAYKILANAGYMYRGNPINTNMGMDIPF